MQLRETQIPCGDLNLAALRYLPNRDASGTQLIFAHGLTSGKYSLDGLAGYLADRGFGGITFDMPGHKLGSTGGAMHSVFQAADCMAAVAAWVRQRAEAQRIVLVGHSMGAAAALCAAARERQLPTNETIPLAGVVSICMGVRPFRGFQTSGGVAMLAQRSDYVAGAPTEQLLKEIDEMVLGAAYIGELRALFIAARRDIVISVPWVEELARSVSNAQYQLVDSSHLEAPDRSRAALLHWLQQA